MGGWAEGSKASLCLGGSRRPSWWHLLGLRRAWPCEFMSPPHSELRMGGGGRATSFIAHQIFLEHRSSPRKLLLTPEDPSGASSLGKPSVIAQTHPAPGSSPWCPELLGPHISQLKLHVCRCDSIDEACSVTSERHLSQPQLSLLQNGDGHPPRPGQAQGWLEEGVFSV